MRQLQGLDMSFVALETPRSPMHIGSILIYDPATAPGGTVTFDQIARFVAMRLQLSRTVRRRLVKVPLSLDYPYWVEDETFDLRRHLHRMILPDPGTAHQLYSEAARIFARPLDLSRPPWEFTIIEGIGKVPGLPRNGYAIIAKVHHAAIDGLSGIDLLNALHTQSPDPDAPQEPDRWRPERVPSPIELLGRAWLNSARNPLRSLQLVGNAAPALMRVVKGAANREFTLDAEVSVPRTAFNAAVSPRRVVQSFSLKLRDAREIRALAPGCKLNDVFLAIIGGALHRYLENRGELPARSLTALVPISVRGKHEEDDLGNQVAAMIAQLGTQIADPAERLRWVQARTRNAKALTDAIGARKMSEISNESPALFLALGAQLLARRGRNDSKSPLYNTLVTNVPGPKRPLYSAGARLHQMMGLMCLTDGMGLAHVVQSYCDEATITFTADRDMMPDPESYAECIARSYRELRAAARATAC